MFEQNRIDVVPIYVYAGLTFFEFISMPARRFPYLCLSGLDVFPVKKKIENIPS